MCRLILFFLILKSTLAMSSRPYNEQGHFTEEQELIEKVITDARNQIRQSVFTISEQIKNKDYSILSKYYGDFPDKHKEAIILRRIQKSHEYLQKITSKDIKSVDWARKHHPNHDFRSMGLGNGIKIWGAVNEYGKQSTDVEDFIVDNSIYLGSKFFNSDLKLITIIHEVSHLINGETFLDENGDISFLNSEIDPYIFTRDLFIHSAHDPDILIDSYQWEKFLGEYLAETY